MFDLDATKFLIVGAAALIFIPPKDLPRVMRQAGQFVGKMKRMASEFQGQFMDAMREADMAELRREAQELSRSTRVDLGLDKLNTHMSDAIGSKPFLPAPVNGSIASSAAPPSAIAPSVPAPALSPSEPLHDATIQSATAETVHATGQHAGAPPAPISEPATHSA